MITSAFAPTTIRRGPKLKRLEGFNRALVRAALLSAPAMLGCSHESGGSHDDACSSPAPLVSQEDSASALDLLQQLRARFSRSRPGATPPGVSRAAALATSPLNPGDRKSFERALTRGGAPAHANLERIEREVSAASLALTAAAPSAFTMAEGGEHVSISGRLGNLATVTPALADGYLIWRDALGANAHVLRRFQNDGFEDFVAFEQAPSSPELVYDVHLEPNVAGLRLVADTLEFLDESGTPRLRVGRPSILSSDGTEVAAHLMLSGCDADTSEVAPWGRPVVAPLQVLPTVRCTWCGTQKASPIPRSSIPRG